MIVCHCNVLSDKDILATLANEPLTMPRSPVQVYKCLGCASNCGRCLTTVRKLLSEARTACACQPLSPMCGPWAVPAGGSACILTAARQ